MLNERERRILARIERHFVESDPDFARLFAAAVPYRGDGVGLMFLLVAGLVLLVLGSLVAAAPVAFVGMVLSVFALIAAHTRPSSFGRPVL